MHAVSASDRAAVTAQLRNENAECPSWERVQVPFGGSYRERWSEDYSLSIDYENRRLVEARWENGTWQARAGDSAWLEALGAAQSDSLPAKYFQAAASVASALQRCRAQGLRPERLDEVLQLGNNPMAAPELMRSLMDDCGLSMNMAYQVTALCCEDLFALGVDAGELFPLQPRTAHVLGILRSCGAQNLAAVHNSLDPAFRTPFGAVTEGTALCLSFRVRIGRIKKAVLQVYGDAFQKEYPMTGEGERYTVRFQTPDQAAALWYRFRLETAESTWWLCPDERGYVGRIYGYEAPGFRLTVYRKDFETPAWFRKRVLYQIFPDRFAFSADGTAEQGLAYHQSLGQTPELHRSLDEPVRWQPRPFETDYSPDDFYGGTLNGIREKLPYLRDLGVDCLYLNPIVEARSNHRYDTGNYLRVDPILGTNEAFGHLCREAEAMGIRVILDGVFSHTGADSVYFNAQGHYPAPGACQGPVSPYYGWYEFQHFPDEYRCWWGFRDLPEVQETDPAWQDFVITGRDSVVKTWLRRGAAGWRLDVADELPDSVLALIRQASKEEKPDAVILGEVWEDAVIKESYGSRRNYALGYSLDTVMNYPLRSAVLDFIHGRLDAYGLRDFLIDQQANYPKPMYYSLMNLLGSHDVERLLTALSTAETVKYMHREEQVKLHFDEAVTELARRREKLCAAIQFSLPGVPSIYYGDEQGMSGGCDPFNRQVFREGDREMHDCYASLARKRRENDALSTGQAQFLALSADVLLILRYVTGGQDAFGLPAKDGVWLTAVNRGAEPAAYQVDTAWLNCGLVTGRLDACTAEIRQIG